MTSLQSDDPWSAFGDEDSDDNDDGDGLDRKNAGETSLTVQTIDIVVSHLAQRLVQRDASVPLSQRFIGIVASCSTEEGHDANTVATTTTLTTTDEYFRQWKDALGRKQMNNVIIYSEHEIRLQAQVQAPNERPNIHDQNGSLNVGALEGSLDAVIWFTSLSHLSNVGEVSSKEAEEAPNNVLDQIETLLVPGGMLLYVQTSTETNDDAMWRHNTVSTLDRSYWWDLESLETIHRTSTHDNRPTETDVSPPEASSLMWKSILKWKCQLAIETCLWLSKQNRHHSIPDERRKLASATVALSVHERTQREPGNSSSNHANGTSNNQAVTFTESISLSPNSIRAAVSAIQTHGYCLLSGLLSSADRQQCLVYGKAVLDDLHAAAERLKHEGIDLYHPMDGTKEPDTYRELSMREDRRMDVRFGPALNALRGSSGGNHPVTIRASDVGLPTNNFFLRGNPNLLAIVRRVMNPVISPHLSAGNFGRYNFDGGGPDGSFQPLTAGIVGGIVSLPGSVDQAIHADTPHLFEHIVDPPLPAHYINVFTPGCSAVDQVGQTAYVHGSHRLDFVAQYCQKDSSKSLEPFHSSIWEHLIRPRLDVGDVLLFDCRILHFGLANHHCSVERPLLYANMTMHWFHDPKNWEQQRRIFDGNDEV